MNSDNYFDKFMDDIVIKENQRKQNVQPETRLSIEYKKRLEQRARNSIRVGVKK